MTEYIRHLEAKIENLEGRLSGSQQHGKGSPNPKPPNSVAGARHENSMASNQEGQRPPHLEQTNRSDATTRQSQDVPGIKSETQTAAKEDERLRQQEIKNKQDEKEKEEKEDKQSKQKK